MPPDTAPIAETPAAPAAPAAPGAAKKIVIPTAQAAGQPQVTAKLLARGTDTTPTVHDVSPPVSVIHKLSFTPQQALALLGAIDAQAPEGKLADKVQAQVGPNGELYLTVTYRQ
jgi:hypothetical protein